jgi:hypothetical protein
MQTFSDETFRVFLGDAWLTQKYDWGIEWRFSVSAQKLKDFSSIFRETLYHHHSSFSLHDEIAELGFVLSAQALKNLYSGNPTDHNTKMGNLGEVLGTHLSSTYLGYQAKPIYPKRFSTNVEQSMKGIDVLSFKDSNSPAEILIGEVKTGQRFYKTNSGDKKNPIEDAYETLWKHQENEDLPKMLHFARAYFQNDKASLANVERHMKKGTPRKFLLLSVTKSKPREPFSNIPEYRKKYGAIEELLAIHIEIKGLREFIEPLYSEFNHV